MAPDPSASLLKLAPYLVGCARRGIVGSSRYALRLRDQIRTAAADPTSHPVLISGEPGLEKDNIAALIHFGSRARRRLLVRLDGATLREDGASLFGSASGDGEGSLLDGLGEGALLVDKLDQVPAALQPLLLELATSGRWRSPAADSPA